MATARGESDLTRVRPRGAYGVPSDLTDGFAKNTRAVFFYARHSLSLILACAFLHVFAFQWPRRSNERIPRGRVRRGDVRRVFRIRRGRLNSAGVVSPAEITCARRSSRCSSLSFFTSDGRSPRARGASFAYPDMSPLRDAPRRRSSRSRDGVLASDKNQRRTSLFLFFCRHWKACVARRRTNDWIADAVHRLAGCITHPDVDSRAHAGGDRRRRRRRGSRGRRRYRRAAGCAVGAATRAHACEAIEAMAASPRGVMAAQRACLVPLLRRCLLDASSEFVHRGGGARGGRDGEIREGRVASVPVGRGFVCARACINASGSGTSRWRFSSGGTIAAPRTRRAFGTNSDWGSRTRRGGHRRIGSTRSWTGTCAIGHIARGRRRRRRRTGRRSPRAFARCGDSSSRKCDRRRTRRRRRGRRRNVSAPERRRARPIRRLRTPRDARDVGNFNPGGAGENAPGRTRRRRRRRDSMRRVHPRGTQSRGRGEDAARRRARHARPREENRGRTSARWA